nr:PRC-barrel domain-containing protein [uncultured Halomonas sp.]
MNCKDVISPDTWKNQEPGSELIGVSDLIGDDVFNHQNEKLGYIKELIADISTGEVEYAVLSFGILLGMPEKIFTVPWKALKLDAEYEHFLIDATFMLNAKKEDLKNPPGFDKDSWPYMADKDWDEVDSFFKTDKTDAFKYDYRSGG